MNSATPFRRPPAVRAAIAAALLALAVLAVPAARGAQVTLAWEPSAGAQGYRLHHGTRSGIYDTEVDVGDATRCTLTGLAEGVPHYIAVSAYNASTQSDYSAEVVWEAAVNLPPSAQAGPDQVVAALTVVTLDGSRTEDPDDGLAQLVWRQVSGPAVRLSDPSAEVVTFTAPEVGEAGERLVFELAVSDHAGQAAADTCTVTVTPRPEELTPAETPAAAQPADTVRVLLAHWQPHRRRLTVLAATDAPGPQTRLTAWAQGGEGRTLLGELRFDRRLKLYRGRFKHVASPPERVVVTSAAGGEAAGDILAR